ncbi:formin-like protein 20 [Gossypium hirsutum]|uniref:Formin-like protein 20 n=1 Tax=Gossypium hirsutum TaxID=3635 RepID=A0ABM3C462_GOSHI|nr:formin-like protein 20 [Gossypium hirsutum]
MYLSKMMKVPQVESKLRVFCFKIQFRTQVWRYLHSKSDLINLQYYSIINLLLVSPFSFIESLVYPLFLHFFTTCRFLNLKELNTVNSACNEVRNFLKLKDLMKKILYLGNTLNQGTARGLSFCWIHGPGLADSCIVTTCLS